MTQRGKKAKPTQDELKAEGEAKLVARTQLEEEFQELPIYIDHIDHLKSYRSHLVQAEQQAQSDFDKAVLSLSGGALGVSFAFLDNVVGAGPYASKLALIGSWTCWGASLTVILLSFFLSQQSLRKAIQQVDDRSIHNEKPGGRFATATAWFNALGGCFFALGVLLMVIFVIANLDRLV